MNLKITLPQGLSLDYDRDYGCAHREGWSVALNGSYVVQFERWLLVALWKAWRRR